MSPPSYSMLANIRFKTGMLVIATLKLAAAFMSVQILPGVVKVTT